MAALMESRLSALPIKDLKKLFSRHSITPPVAVSEKSELVNALLAAPRKSVTIRAFSDVV